MLAGWLPPLPLLIVSAQESGLRSMPCDHSPSSKAKPPLRSDPRGLTIRSLVTIGCVSANHRRWHICASDSLNLRRDL